tara:strand:+ start:758 stop:1567 length:810 start_codon:yes stop_codon:yes gene_type:complete
MICYPNAKINLGLKILSKRQDGFHNISSFFLPVPLFDILELQISSSSIGSNKITYSGLITDYIENDLVIKAYDLLNNDFDLLPLNIHLHKCIPFGSGLGGGSSNAAFMLIMLNRIFNLKLSLPQLCEYGLHIGSDCPFFIYNSFSNVSSIGDIIKPVNFSFRGYYLVLIKPKIHCSTAKIFNLFTMNNFNKNPLKFNNDIFEWKDNLKNDLEAVVFDLYPELETIKNYLYSKGAFYASMSGSGSVIYGLFEHEPIINNEFNCWYWKSKI